MSFSHMFDFLERLQENNHKAWMDENRKEYKVVRSFFVEWLDEMNDKLTKIDPQYFDTPGKKAINRINNNLLYHPDLPTYKDHFGAGLDQVTKMGDFYIQIGVNNSMIASGYWKPPSKQIKSIREAIDYNGEVLKEIINEKKFNQTFGSLIDRENCLVKAPQGFDNNHPHIDLLKFKTFAVIQTLSRNEICAEAFNNQVIESYKILLPFRRYLNQAVSV